MLYISFVLVVLTALGHSFLSERIVLRPFRRQGAGQTVFAHYSTRRVTEIMFHLASVCWVGFGIIVLLLDVSAPAHRGVLYMPLQQFVGHRMLIETFGREIDTQVVAHGTH